MTGSTPTPTDMAYTGGPAAVQAPDSTSRVVLPNPAAQAPPSLSLPPLAPQPPSLATPQGAGFAVGENNGCAVECDGAGCYYNPLWTLRADAVFLTRSAPPGKVLIGDAWAGRCWTRVNSTRIRPPVGMSR